jgi:hypothetical protein
MQHKTRFYRSLLVILLLLAVAYLAVPSAPTPADAAAVTSYQSLTLLDGSTAYTTTTYTPAYLSGGYGQITLQVNNDVSGTNTITITPQFANDLLACSANNKDWADATVSGVFAGVSTVTVSTTTTITTSPVAFGVLPVYQTLTGDGATLVGFPTQGRCFRVKLTTSTTFTPTVYARMENVQ